MPPFLAQWWYTMERGNPTPPVGTIWLLDPSTTYLLDPATTALLD